MALATDVLTTIEIVEYPRNAVSELSFYKPIQISWPDLTPSPFILCVGTADGRWDILSGQVSNRRQQLFDFSDVAADTVYVQLIAGDEGVVGPTIEIRRK